MSTLASEKADSVITHLLEAMDIMGIPRQINDNAPAYVFSNMKWFFKHIMMQNILQVKSIGGEIQLYFKRNA